MQQSSPQQSQPDAGASKTSSTAPDAPQAAKSDDTAAKAPADIVITGSRIRRTSTTTAAPIAILDKEVIAQRGFGRLSDTLNIMPQVTPGLGARGSSGLAGPAQVNLRNLGVGRTLTLLNGERIDNDSDVIPAALIDRVDILTGGASAVYGSDAIAGVVNFIVKRRFKGLEVNLDASTQQSTNDNTFLRNLLTEAGYPLPDRHFWGGQQYFGSIAAGQNFAEDRGNISMFASYTRTVPIEMSKLDHSACPIYNDPQNPIPTIQTNSKFSCGYSDFNPYYLFTTGGQDYSNAKDGSQTWRPYDPADVVNVPVRDYLQRSQRRANVGGFLTYDISSALKFDASVLYTFDNQDGRETQRGTLLIPDTPIPCDNPFLSPQQAQTICGTSTPAPGTTGTIAAYLSRPNSNSMYQNETNSLRVSGHVSGKIVDNINFDTSVQRTKRVERYFGTNLLDDTFSAAAGAQAFNVVNYNGVPTCVSKIDGTNPNCVPINPFGLNTMTDAMWNFLYGDGGFEVKVEQTIFNGSISGTLENIGLKSPWAKDAIGFAVVAEQRRDKVSNGGEGIYQSFTRFSSTDQVRELGGELSLPIVQNKPWLNDLTVSGAYRISKYRSLDRLAKTWKADFIYRPFPELGFRGSINRALRRGVLERLQEAPPYNALFRDRCAAPGPGSNIQRLSFEQCSASGITRPQYDALAAGAGCDINQLCDTRFQPGGNPKLRPETSRSITAGVVAEPRFLRGFRATVDYYSIRIDDAFEFVRTDIISDQCFNQNVAFFCGLISRDPQTGQITEINARYNNSGFRKTKGVDFALYYPIKLDRELLGFNAGQIDLGYNGTLNIADQRQFAPNTAVASCRGYFAFFCGDPSPKFRHVATLGWEMPWKGNITLAWRYASPTRNSKLSSNPALGPMPTDTNTDTYPLIPRLPAQSLFDLSFSYPITDAVELRFNVQNLFDKDPPIIGNADAGTGTAFNTYPGYYEVLGRTLRIGVKAKLW